MEAGGINETGGSLGSERIKFSGHCCPNLYFNIFPSVDKSDLVYKENDKSRCFDGLH